MAGGFGVSFAIGAHLQSSVGSAFASLGGKSGGDAVSFHNAERQSSALGVVIVKQRERTDAMARTLTPCASRRELGATTVWSIALFESLEPAFRRITQAATDVVRPIGEWIKQNPRLVQGIVLIGGAMVGLKAAGMAFTFLNSYRSSFAGGVMSMRGQVSGALSSVGGAFGRLRSELNKPVSLSTQGVSQGVASMKSKFESLRQSLGRTMTTLRNFKPSVMAAGAAAAAFGTVAAAGRVGGRKNARADRARGKVGARGARRQAQRGRESGEIRGGQGGEKSRAAQTGMLRNKGKRLQKPLLPNP